MGKESSGLNPISPPTLVSGAIGELLRKKKLRLGRARGVHSNSLLGFIDSRTESSTWTEEGGGEEGLLSCGRVGELRSEREESRTRSWIQMDEARG